MIRTVIKPHYQDNHNIDTDTIRFLFRPSRDNGIDMKPAEPYFHWRHLSYYLTDDSGRPQREQILRGTRSDRPVGAQFRQRVTPWVWACYVGFFQDAGSCGHQLLSDIQRGRSTEGGGGMEPALDEQLYEDSVWNPADRKGRDKLIFIDSEITYDNIIAFAYILLYE